MNLRHLRLYNKVLRVIPVEQLDESTMLLAGHQLKSMYFDWRVKDYFSFKRQLDVKYFNGRDISPKECITSIIWLLNRMEVVIAHQHLQHENNVNSLYRMIQQALPTHIVQEIKEDRIPSILGAKLDKNELTRIQWGKEIPIEKPVSLLEKITNLFTH